MKTVFALFLILSISSSALAQSAALTGVVRDSSGAIVAGTTIVVHRAGSAFERIVESGRDGRFTIGPLDDGEYTLDVIAPGFAMLNTTARVPSTESACPSSGRRVPPKGSDEVEITTSGSIVSGSAACASSTTSVTERSVVSPWNRRRGCRCRRRSAITGIAGTNPS